MARKYVKLWSLAQERTKAKARARPPTGESGDSIGGSRDLKVLGASGLFPLHLARSCSSFMVLVR